jgi:pyruvate/2-oxoglutarate dehydrogenase complex dihydrolipoamide acyltransferase (E2) component
LSSADSENQVMRTPVVMPDVGAATPIVSVWFVSLAERVYAGDRLVEILIAGATIDVTAPVSGRLVEIMAWPDAAVTPGEVLGFVEEEA